MFEFESSSPPPQPYALLIRVEGERPPLFYGDDVMPHRLVKWARALRERYGVKKGVRLTLQKVIPAGGGLGAGRAGLQPLVEQQRRSPPPHNP